MKLIVNTQRISIKDPYMLVTGTTGVYKIEFEIGSDVFELWADLNIKMATFKKWKKDICVTVPLDSDDSCMIPQEMLTDTEGFIVGLFGVTEGIQYNTIWSSKLVPHEGCVLGSEASQPTPGVWDEILRILKVTEEDADASREFAEAAALSAITAQEAAIDASESASSAAGDAERAAESASEAVTKSTQALTNSQIAIETSNEAKELVSDMSVEAEGLPAGFQPEVEIEDADGHYNIIFSIPKGDKGDKGDKGEKGEPGPGSGDMLRSEYDPDDAVRISGGIADYFTNKSPNVLNSDNKKLNELIDITVGFKNTITVPGFNFTWDGDHTGMELLGEYCKYSDTALITDVNEVIGGTATVTTIYMGETSETEIEITSENALSDPENLVVFIITQDGIPFIMSLKTEFEGAQPGFYVLCYESYNYKQYVSSIYKEDGKIEVITKIPEDYLDVSIPKELSELTDDSEHRLVTDDDIDNWNAKYTKPSSGIPAGDINSQDVMYWNSKYKKPNGGIPASDIAPGVIPSILDDFEIEIIWRES